MLDLNKYKNIILDFDGVIVDSNTVKKKSIQKAAKHFLDEEKLMEFVNYFTAHNGVPREYKIRKYFTDDTTYRNVLSEYTKDLSNQLKEIKFTKNFEVFLKKLEFYKLPIYILSGGDEKEIQLFLQNKNIFNSFKKVMSGPLTKYENVDNLNFIGKTLYIGDSKIDYEVGEKYQFDFIFMYGYTQFKEWKSFFNDKDIFMSIKDFSALTNCKC